ncbi:heterokaryon incompatibility protein-domain-containing protein [Bisporella sp. PMI_857]|nr:heterokaryon incompatibility protein-domain-containing protein [Bisporella sp. PMI_857]
MDRPQGQTSIISALANSTQKGGNFCDVCKMLDLTLTHQQSSNIGNFKILDAFLGWKSDLQSKSAWCASCKAIIALADEHVASLNDALKQRFQTDYELSAHFMDQAPRLWIAFGESTTPKGDASARRRHLTELGAIWLFSPDDEITKESSVWPLGKPQLFDPAKVDTASILKWLQQCGSCHDQKCQLFNTWLGKGEVQPSFIDVQQECIVTPDKDLDYVALSYVWGAVETLQATKANISELMKPGSLSIGGGNVVPRTIRDSMVLCARLGRKLLWVDRVCIVQDDYETKAKHLNTMGTIYAKAEFTIVAADGSHADHGLAGVGQSVEERERHLVPFLSRKMMRGTMWSAGTSRLSQTVWSERAWTFQEHIFSRRLLYFNKFVNWICFSARWTESWSSPVETLEGRELELKKAGESGKLYTLDWPSLTEYASMVEQYNSRHLRYDSDIIDAFGGVMLYMAEGFPAGFCGGLPEFYFTICLLWQPRKGLRPRTQQPNTSHIPSWSWVGWSGSLDLSMWACNTDTALPAAEYEVTISPLVEWYKHLDKSTKVDDTCFVVRNHFLLKNAAPPHGWEKHDSDEAAGTDTYYTYHGYYGNNHINPDIRFRYPMPPFQRPRDVRRELEHIQYLYIRTQRAFFHLGTPATGAPTRQAAHSDSNIYCAIDIPLVNRDGSWVGSIRVNILLGEELPTKHIELIRIAQGSVPVHSKTDMTLEQRVRAAATQAGRGLQLEHPFRECVEREEVKNGSVFDFYFVLWVEVKRGIARRKALGTVWMPAWDKASPQEVDVILG